MATTATEHRLPEVAQLAIDRKLEWKVWQACKFMPHEAQARVLRSMARNKVVAGGRRVGKSEIGAAELDAEVLVTKMMLPFLRDNGKRNEFWIVGPEYTDSEKEFRKHWNALKAWGIPFDKPGSYYDAHAGDMQLSVFEGKYLVIGKSAKHPERLVGEGLSGVIMAEAAKLKESTWSKYIRPTLADFIGWSLFPTTPEGKNWLYELWQAGIDPNNDEWESWRLPSWMNPYVYPGGATDASVTTLRAALNQGGFDFRKLVKRLGMDPEIASLVRDLDEVTFNQEIGAGFSDFVGRVFGDWDEETHVADLEYNPAWPTFAAVDYGFTNPFVWLVLQIDPFDNVYIIDEFYERGLTIDDAAREIKGRPNLLPANLKMFYPDPAEPGDTLALCKHLKIEAGGGTGGELKTRIRYIREALKVRNKHLPFGDPERKPKLLVDRQRCPNTIYEMDAYRYANGNESRDRNNPEAPLKKDDHCPEAIGRFYAGYYGKPEQQSGTSTVRKAQYKRR